MERRRIAFIVTFFKTPSTTIPLVQFVHMENKIGTKFRGMNTWLKIFGIKFKLRI